jgi:hypothetical protein
MEYTAQNPRGLARLIYESLTAAAPEMQAEGEFWTPELLDRVEAELHGRLRPAGSTRSAAIFDMVFRRSFAEARELILADTYLGLSPEGLAGLRGTAA